MEVGTLKFTWKIKNFSTLHTKELNSDVFSLRHYKWKISAFPKGSTLDQNLSIFLNVADSEALPSGWTRKAKFSFTVIDQIDNKSSVTASEDDEHEFNAEGTSWGFYSFISHKQLYNSNKGYLVGDTCIIDAAVTIYEDIASNESTEEDMDAFFGDLNSVIFPQKVVSSEEEAKQALAIIEAAFNMVPSDLNNLGRMSQMTNAFDVLSTLDDGSILAPEQKAELMSMKQKFVDLPERASNAVKDINLFTEKVLVKTTLDQKLGRCLIEYEKAKAETILKEQNIANLRKQIGEMIREKENSLSKQKDTFNLSKELKAELDVLVKDWHEYEAKMKVAKEEEQVVSTEWSKMKQLFSSLKEPFYSSYKSQERKPVRKRSLQMLN